MKAIITSKNTSTNKEKVPAIYKKLDKCAVHGTHLFDVGCGKWTKHIAKYAKDHAICDHWHGFDPYNQTKQNNEDVTKVAWSEKLRPYGEENPNVFVSSNVLNVIKGSERQRGYLQSIFRMMKRIDECYITVYEGDKSGSGRMTKKDCWQENKRLIEYFELVKMAYRDTHVSDYMDRLPVHSIDIKYGMIRVLPAY